MENFALKYFPFGSQYYRAPSPHRQEWAQDLKAMSGMGFNIVKFWIQWRWNNPAEGKYFFDDIDELMDLAHQNNLKVMLNTIFDVAPAWIYNKYPDASMVTLNGKKIGPQTQPHRQIGGLGYCFNHDGVTSHQFEFLKEAVNRYKDHPALDIWNVGSEPELTSSMAEMRLYADNAEKMDDMLCYCDNCRKKFKYWLEKKYQSLDNLNRCWNRNYQSFDEAELPKTRNTFNDVIDWRMFFVSILGENVKRRFETAYKADSSHPLMCHHVFVQGFPVTSTASDPWNIGKYGDLHGFTQMDDAMMIDVLRSCAKDKTVISAEMLMLPGYTLDLPSFIDENDIKKLIFRGIAGNLKGFIFWQYRPEILGREAPTWGLTWLDGSETPWLQSFAKVGEVLQKNSELLLNASPQKSQVALLYNPENQVFAWASTGNEKTATHSLLGVHKALYERNYNIDFIHPSELPKGILNNYKVLYIPFPYYLSKEICTELERWVKSGGILIGEAYFAAWNKENGHHEKIVPGYGMHKVFKAKQGVVEPANLNSIESIILLKQLGMVRKDNFVKPNLKKETLKLRQNIFDTMEDNGAELELTEDLTYLHKNDKVKGTLIRETLISDGAEVIANFSTGEPAITAAEYGKGKAILIGTYPGLTYFNTKEQGAADLITGIIEKYSKVERPEVIGNLKVRTDILTSADKDLFIIVQNLEADYKEISVRLPAKINTMIEQFTSTSVEPVNENNSATLIHLKLNPKEVKVYRAQLAE